VPPPNSQAGIGVLVVDDEPLARSNITVLLSGDADIRWVRECGAGRQSLEDIRTLKPDLVFLDVQMPEFDGFQVLKALGVVAPVIVFVTAYDEHALRAFDAGALDYLLKPFDNARFALALDRAKGRLLPGGAASALERGPFAIKGTGHITYVEHIEVDWIEAADYYVSIHVGTKSHLLRRSLAELEQELDSRLFCRVHRSAIVNLKRVRSLKLGDGDAEVVLASGARLPVSRRYRKEIQARLATRL
jgi:two-component system, LytTR family, response regulator